MRAVIVSSIVITVTAIISNFHVSILASVAVDEMVAVVLTRGFHLRTRYRWYRLLLRCSISVIHAKLKLHFFIT